MYILYYKENVRRAFVDKVETLTEALNYLDKAEYGVVGYEGSYYNNKEELKNAKSKRSNVEFRFDNATTSGGEVSESSDRELHQVVEESGGESSSSESSPECDS